MKFCYNWPGWNEGVPVLQVNYLSTFKAVQNDYNPKCMWKPLKNTSPLKKQNYSLLHFVDLVFQISFPNEHQRAMFPCVSLGQSNFEILSDLFKALLRLLCTA